jgi:SAM-dependent methyltransferase
LGRLWFIDRFIVGNGGAVWFRLRVCATLYGGRIPHPDQSFDVVFFLDVLHHTTDPMSLLKEARRVSRKYIIIKDHNRDGFEAGPLLRFMDWMANAPHGVVLPYNYWSRKQWQSAFGELGLKMSEYRGQLGLYPFPGNWVSSGRCTSSPGWRLVRTIGSGRIERSSLIQDNAWLDDLRTPARGSDQPHRNRTPQS